MLSRRAFGNLVGTAACVGAAASSASGPAIDLNAIPPAEHEAAMRLAIAAAKANPHYPFGAVIIGAADRAVLAEGVNNSKANPILHGEIVAINNYVARRANQSWSEGIVYTTGEPCPMCMSAIVWGRHRRGRLWQLDLDAGAGRHRRNHDRRERGARRRTVLSRPDNRRRPASGDRRVVPQSATGIRLFDAG
jgi:tRNA(Arg) A34 adenosine deaminase TadA